LDPIIKSDILKLESENVRSKVTELLDEIKQTKNKSEIQRKIKLIKQRLRKIPFAIYRKYLKDNKRKIFDLQYDLYYKDPLVKERLMDKGAEKEFVNSFIDLSRKSCFIVKGTRDLDAMNNIASILKTKNNFDFNHIYDIELFNGFSKIKFGNAQLEKTYDGLIQMPIYKKNKTDLEVILGSIGGVAHNPVMDSYYTLVVALIINVGMNDCFPNISQLEGGDPTLINFKKENFYDMYLYAKLKYTIAKNDVVNQL